MNVGSLLPGFEPGFHAAGFGYGDAGYDILREMARNDYVEMSKALTTGDGIVASGDTGGTALRTQFIHGAIEKASYEAEDCAVMRRLKNMKVHSTVVEWTTQGAYGGAGHGFISETGSDGAFNGTAADENFRRRTRKIKYRATVREVGLVAQKVDNLTNPMTLVREGAALELVGKANRAVYFGDSFRQTVEFDGFERQVMDWVTENPDDLALLYDAQGQPVDDGMLNDIAKVVREKFGKLSVLLTSVQTKADTNKIRFPQLRGQFGDTGTAGLNLDKFRSDSGVFDLVDDVILRASRPLKIDGPGSNGKPRTATSKDASSVDWNATPWSACTAGTAGTGNFWETFTVNTSASSVTKPAVPSGSEGNAKNNLAAGSYYYAVSVVWDGLEGQPWCFGSTAVAGTSGDGDLGSAPTAVAVTDGQVVTVTLLAASITSIARTRTKVRIYRYGGPNAAAPTKLSDFEFLMETGWPTTGNVTCYDNGFWIPGKDTAFGLTEVKNGAKGAFMAELLPMMERPLPNKLLSDLVGYVAFDCPLLWVPRHHIVIRNIGKYQV